jgi:Kef-type K+ transport system membrane component KefB
VAMFVVVRPFLARLVKRGPSPGAVTQNLIAGATLAALASSWLTEAIGIHALFGAFVFGAIVPREGGMARAMAVRLEDLILLVWLPVFFASTGLRTEIGLLSSGSEWALCGLVIAVACIGKIGGAGLSAWLLGFRWREAGTIGLLMNTRGLMELVVLSIGLDLGILSRLTFTMLVLMAVVTTFMTVPLLHVIVRPGGPVRAPRTAR